MPVVNLAVSRLKRMLPGIEIGRALDLLPFLGLDIEGQEGDLVRVEYNPNRPDFSSSIGIVRGLRGLLGIQTGLPRIEVDGRSGYSVVVERKVLPVRPYIVAAVASGASLDDATIQEMISMQEDLHGGLGRSRRKASIGFHDLGSVKFPARYTVVDRDFRFTPLGESHDMTVEQVLTQTPTGRKFAHLVSGASGCPALVDDAGKVMSLPPIVNGNETRVDIAASGLFVEVTGVDRRACEDIMSVIASTLFDAGFKIKTVRVVSGRKHLDTPSLPTKRITVSSQYVNDLLGTNISVRDLKKCFERARLGTTASGKLIACTIPPYRSDLSSGIDLVEEAAIGYGISKLTPSLPPSYITGETSELSKQLDSIRQSFVGLGFLETLGFSLTNEEIQYAPFGKERPEQTLMVESPKSSEHEILRKSIIPSLLQVLSRNIHETYPQRLFEIGKVFHSTLYESWSVAAVIAHSDADFTEAKSVAQATVGSAFGVTLSTRSAEDQHFISGRAGEILIDGEIVGEVGEISPGALEWFKLRTPVSAFELDLSEILATSTSAQ